MSRLAAWLMKCRTPNLRQPLRPRLESVALEDRLAPATFTIFSTSDAALPDSFLTLREAITAVNAGNDSSLTASEKGSVSGTFGVADTINLIGSGTITLGSALPSLAKAVTINGPGVGQLAISGNNAFQIFNAEPANPGTVFSFNKISLTQGKANEGGAINIGNETVNLVDCILSNNQALTEGGAVNVQSTGTLNLTRTTLSGNTAANDGGAIYWNNSGGGLILDSAIINNKATSGIGGGVYFFGTPNASGLTFRNTTISGNSSASSGGGIVLANFNGTANVQNSTIAKNTAATGAGGGIGLISGSGFADIVNSIIDGNSAPSGIDFQTGTTNFGLNFSAFGSFTGGFNSINPNLIAQNLMLAPLANNGGPTLTHAFDAFSPLRNAGTNTGAPATDARGNARISNGTIDIGAVEMQEVVTNTNDSGSGSLREAVLDANRFPGNNKVMFAATGTITLTSGELAVSEYLDITNAGQAQVTISGNNASRIFNTSSNPGTNGLSLRNLRLINGKGVGDGGAIFVQDETILLEDCVVANSSASDDGGAINVQGVGSVGLIRSTLSGNTANQSGGAIYFFQNGSVYLRDSSIVNNKATTETGGGVYFYGSVGASGFFVRNSTISGNSSAGDGGGIVLRNFTGTANIINSTIFGNTSSGTGGGISRSSGAGTIDIDSSIVSNNIGSPIQDISSGGTVNVDFSAIGSLAGFTLTGGNNKIAQSLDLSPLTQTGNLFVHIPATESPVKDAGSNINGLAKDARGLPRVLNAVADIGAVEIHNPFVRNDANAGKDSLRQQVLDANAVAGPDVIAFDTAFFTSAKTITLAAQLDIADAVTITGPGAGLATVSGNNLVRIINTETSPNAAAITISGLTLANGKSDFAGALLFADEAVSIRDSAIIGNTATNAAGAIVGLATGGSLNLERTTVSGNSATNNGGAVYMNFGVGLTIRNSTFANNTSNGSGGALRLISGTPTIQNSTFVGNKAANSGGAVLQEPSVVLTVESCIISGNTAISNADISGGTVNAKNSAIGSSAGFTFNDQGGNLAFGTNLKLGALANNGGPTDTILPAADSPLVGKGSNPAALATDQRGVGFPRVVGGTIDIGAVEAPFIFSLVVSNDADSGPGSLRQAILNANSQVGNDTITFDPAFFSTAKTITLASTIDIADAVTIAGPGARLANVSGNNANRIFSTYPAPAGAAVTISGLTISGGSAGQGGAIANLSQILTLNDCTLSGNTAMGNGGAILSFNYAPGSVTLNNCTVTGNSAGGVGGAIRTNPASPLIIRSSTFSGNSATGNGGAINSSGSISVQNSTIVGNKSAGVGGGISAGTVTIESSIVSGNFASSNVDINGGTVNAKTSAIGSSAGFTFNDQGGNLAFGTNLKLGTLANNGGSTDTILPAADSPLVGKGSNPAALVNDQRGVGFGRVRGTIDIGAVEAATNFVVLNAADAGPGSLRQAVLDANAFVGVDSITFDPTFFATAQTITLGGTDMAINESVTITGPGASLANIDGAAKSRIFFLANNQNATISGLSFRNGLSGGGGAIRASGNNSLTISDSAFINNTSPTGGGGAFTTVGGILNVSRSTFSGNTAATGGGAINALGDVTIDSSTFFNNAVTANNFGGGAINFRSGPNTWLVRNSTISNNSTVSNGGGIGLESGTGTLTVQNCTIVGNTAQGQGGGIGRYGSTVTISVTSSILSGNTATGSGPDVFTAGTVNATTSLLGSLAGITTFSGDPQTNNLVGKAPVLGPLQDNGGPTQTHALLPGSFAINAGSNPAGLATDQRGFARQVGASADIGAFEVQINPNATGFTVNGGNPQRSRITSITVSFDGPVTAATFNTTGAITLTRTGVSSIPTGAVNDVVQTGPAAAGHITVTQGTATSLVLTFDNSGSFTSAGTRVEFGSLTDGYWRLQVGTFQSALSDLNLRRLYGDSTFTVNGTVNTVDLTAFGNDFNGSQAAFDFDNNGVVNSVDLTAFGNRFGNVL